METENLLRIGQLAEKAGVTPRTIRFYVQENLISRPVKAKKNMALYPPDCISQIRVIKKAQTRRFLPLLAIRRILEENNFDHKALEVILDSDDGSPLQWKEEEKGLTDIPNDIRGLLEKRGWIHTEQAKERGKTGSPADGRLMRLFHALNRHGAPWEEMIAALDSIESLAKKTVEVEFQSFTGWALKNPTSDFKDIQNLAQVSLNHFIIQARMRHFAHVVCRHKKDLDYSFMASADEGFAVPPEEIMPQIEAVERRLPPRSPDTRILNDMAIGYSCIGDIDTALRYLRRARRSAPGDLETRVRWIWYRRFLTGHKRAVRMKQQMMDLVAGHPEYAIGRAFLGAWHMLDLMEADDPDDILRLANLCLQELAGAEENMPEDLHQRTLIQYAKSRILMEMPDAADHLVNGLRSFEDIISRKTELDDYYSNHLPFFSKWLWPNIYYFSGTAYERARQYEHAIEMYQNGRRFAVQPPFHERIEAGIVRVESGIRRKERANG